MEQSNNLIEKIFLGVFSKMSRNLAPFSLHQKIVSYYMDELKNFLGQNGIETDILEKNFDTLDYDKYRTFIIDLVTKYEIGRYREFYDEIILSMNYSQIEKISKMTEDINILVEELFKIVTKREYDAFPISIIDGCDLDKGLIEIMPEYIYNPLYSKEVYQELYNLVDEYLTIKIMQKRYPMNTKKEKLETEKKLREDKKKLLGLANNIIYGYNDIFLYYYYWCKPLFRHCMNEAKKEVLIGPTLSKVKNIQMFLEDR